MASLRHILICFLVSFCLLGSALAMPSHHMEETESNELESDDSHEEIPSEEEMLHVKGKDEIEDYHHHVPEDSDEDEEERKDDYEAEDEVKMEEDSDEVKDEDISDEFKHFHEEEDGVKDKDDAYDEEVADADKGVEFGDEEYVLGVKPDEYGGEDKKGFPDDEGKKEFSDEDINEKGFSDEDIDKKSGEEKPKDSHDHVPEKEYKKPGVIKRIFRKMKQIWNNLG